MLLAYHADDEFTRAMLSVGIPLAVVVVALGIVLWHRLPSESRTGRGAWWTLVLALLQVPLAVLGWGFFIWLTLPSLLLVAYAATEVRRNPGRAAVAALVVSGLTASYWAAAWIVCIIVDGCFH